MIGRIWNWLRWRWASRRLVSSLIRAAKRSKLSDVEEDNGVRITRGNCEFFVSEDSLARGGIHWDSTFVLISRSQVLRLRNFLRARRVRLARKALAG